MQKARSSGRWLATAGIIYAGVTGGGIGTATYVDATRPAPRPPVMQEVVLPREALDPAPMTDSLPPCTADAVSKPEIEATNGKQTGVVTVGELNIRQTPGGRIVGQVRSGDQVEILERRTNGGGLEWLRIKSGWVAARFVDTTAPVVQTEPCFPPGPWCPTPSPPFLPPLSQR